MLAPPVLLPIAPIVGVTPVGRPTCAFWVNICCCAPVIKPPVLTLPVDVLAMLNVPGVRVLAPVNSPVPPVDAVLLPVDAELPPEVRVLAPVNSPAPPDATGALSCTGAVCAVLVAAGVLTEPGVTVAAPVSLPATGCVETAGAKAVGVVTEVLEVAPASTTPLFLMGLPPH